MRPREPTLNTGEYSKESKKKHWGPALPDRKDFSWTRQAEPAEPGNFFHRRHGDHGGAGNSEHSGTMVEPSVQWRARGNRTLARAWRRHGAGVARAIGSFWLGVARAWRGHGAGVARACPVSPGPG
eukprot:gene23303-biopygen11822